jgi:cholesterol transport system auxiliary component
MRPKPSILTLAPVLAVALALGGCVSVFPKSKPVRLYRFGQSPPAPAGPAPAAPVLILKGATIFPPASGGDRLLTVTGDRSAFIGGARWVAPASVMFDEDLLRAFDAPGSPRLVERGEPLQAASTLRLDVREFDARYPGPSVVVQVRATLIRNADRSIIAEHLFEANVPAADNRQGPIVTAYDRAAGKVIGDIRDWTAGAAPAR